jgi:hypothetical protein
MSTPSRTSDASPTSHTLSSTVPRAWEKLPASPAPLSWDSHSHTSISVGNLLCGDCKAKNQPPVAWEAMIKRHNKRAVASV